MISSQSTPVRYSERTILNDETLISLLQTTMTGRIAVIAEGEPYIVPMNYAYEQSEPGSLGRVIIHGADQGRLTRALANNPVVCFEIDEYIATIPDPVLCEYDTAYASIICRGHARLLTDLEERTSALRVLARKYAPPAKANALKAKTVERFQSSLGAHTAVIEITLETMTGKQRPGPAPSQV